MTITAIRVLLFIGLFTGIASACPFNKQSRFFGRPCCNRYPSVDSAPEWKTDRVMVTITKVNSATPKQEDSGDYVVHLPKTDTTAVVEVTCDGSSANHSFIVNITQLDSMGQPTGNVSSCPTTTKNIVPYVVNGHIRYRFTVTHTCAFTAKINSYRVNARCDTDQTDAQYPAIVKRDQ